MWKPIKKCTQCTVYSGSVQCKVQCTIHQLSNTTNATKCSRKMSTINFRNFAKTKGESEYYFLCDILKETSNPYYLDEKNVNRFIGQCWENY